MSVRRTGAQRISFILNIFMVLAYGLGGIALFFWKIPSIPDQNRKIASGITGGGGGVDLSIGGGSARVIDSVIAFSLEITTLLI